MNERKFGDPGFLYLEGKLRENTVLVKVYSNARQRQHRQRGPLAKLGKDQKSKLKVKEKAKEDMGENCDKGIKELKNEA